MSISYPLTFPTTIAPETFRLTPEAAVAVSESPWTFQQQAQASSGQKWALDLTLPDLIRADAEPYIAFLLQLNGRYGTFLIGDPNGGTPQGAAAGYSDTLLVKGAGQSGGTLILDGAQASKVGYLKAGDYLQLGTGASTRLHRATADVNSNGSGELSVPIWPNLRESPADNAPVSLTNCKGIFRLTNNQMPYDLKAPFWYSISISASEVI